VFATNAAANADKPRIENGAPGVYIESTVSYKVDTNFPNVYATLSVDSTAAYDFADALPLVTSMSFGGTTGVFKVRTLATDASGIKTVHVAVPGATGSPFPASANGTEVQGGTTYTVYDSGLIDVTSGIADGAITATVEVEDNSGLKTSAMRTILVDNTPPLYAVTTPANNEIVNGDITIKGTALDTTAGLKSVAYKLGYNYDTEGWTPVGGSMYSWEIALTGANRSDLYAGKTVTAIDIASDTATSAGHGFVVGTKVYFSGTPLPGGIASTTTYYVIYATANDFRVSTVAGGASVDITSIGSGVFASAESRDVDNDQIWEFPVLIRAEDNAGNIAVTTLGDYMIKLDPGGDRPRVTVYYPDPADPTKTLGGTIRVYGMATDDDAVDSVYMQIDVNNDGLFDTSDVDTQAVDWYNAGLGQQVIGSANWYRTINEFGEFNPVVDTRVIKIRLRGKDIYGTYGAWTAAQPITIDKNVPQFGSSSPISIDPDTTIGNGNEQPYSVGMYVNGTTVYMRGSVTDDGGITDIQITGAIAGSLAGNPTWFTAGYSGKGYDLAVPISLPADASGSKQFTITAYDNSAIPRESVYEVRINYDNQAPVGALNASASPAAVAQSNGWYKVKGTAEDVGSDIDHVEVFFIRRGNGSSTFDRIYNPGTQNTSVPLSAIDFTGSYPTIKGTASRATLTSLSAVALISNTMIVNGQKILVGANLRTISSFNPTTGQISWTGGDVPLAETAYTIRLAQQVDHKDTVESSVVASGSVTRTTGQEKTLVAPALIGNSDIAVGNTLRIAGQYRIVATWNSASGTITWTGLDVAVGVNQAYEVFSVVNDDGDHYVEYLKQDSGITYTWSVDIKSDAIPDGPIEIHYAVFDKAGNSVHHQTSGYKIQNNGPRMAAIILGADLNDDGTVSSAEKQQFDYSSDIVVSETKTFPFLVKEGPMYIEPVVTNGNGDLKLWITGAFALNNYALRTNSVLAPITLTDANLVNIGDGSRTFTLTIWDSTEETTVGTDSLNIVRGATIDIDYVDGVPPTVAVRPFYWNGSLDNSLYASSRTNGHIEIAGVYDGVDPDVSGQISIRGVAYDDQRIKSLYAYIDGFTFTGAPSTKVIGSYTYALVASYAAGVWTPTDQWAANGWKVSISDSPPDQSGHRISWQLDWDSAKVSGVAAANRVIRIVAEDKAGSPSPATDSANTLTGTGSRPTNNSLIVTPNAAIRAGQLVILGSGEQAYASRIGSYNAGTIVFSDAIDTAITTHTIYLDSHQKASYSVDVVPYIATISTQAKMTTGGLKDVNIRSADGKYSIKTGSDAAFITATGFNLAPIANGVRISNDTYKTGLNGTTLTGSSLAFASASPWTTLTLSNAPATSNGGWLAVVAGTAGAPVPLLNNVNAAIESNQEQDLVLTHNPTLTDDRYINFFSVTDTGIVNGNFVKMMMGTDGSTPYFGYVQSSASYDQLVRRGTTSALNTPIVRILSADQIAMARDSGGKYHMVSVNNFSSGKLVYFYDNFATYYTGGNSFDAGSNNGYTSPYWSGFVGTESGSNNNNAIDMDSVNYTPGQSLGRYLTPRLKVKGDPATGTAYLYLCYFDQSTGDLIFQDWQEGTVVTGASSNLYGGTIKTNKGDLAPASGNSARQTIGNAAIMGVSQYFDMGITSGNIVVIGFYNQLTSKLNIVYSATSSGGTTAAAVTGASPTTAIFWSAPIEINAPYTGWYLSMEIDASDHVHMAAYDTSGADLRYIYMSAYNDAAPKIALIDANNSVGIYTDMKVYGGIPYISYFNNSENGTHDSLKLAWFKGIMPTITDGISSTGNTTGSWEYMTVPCGSVPQGGKNSFVKTNLDFNSAGDPVVGYQGTNIEYSRLLPKLP
jgi:hypothetical protein